jgi:lincosamide nucleotidyltransferase A/C/D/E
VPELCSYLKSRGFRDVERSETKGWNFVVVDDAGRKIDVHSFVFDDHGRVVDGIEYPDGSLTGLGSINGHCVRCIAPEYLVAFGRYEPQDKDRRDVAKLCDKFGLENPWTTD